MHEIAVSREKKNLGHRNAAPLIRRAAEDALRAEGIDVPCLISVMLTDGEGIREVNREFRGIDRETDVLSFPLNELSPGAFDAALSAWSSARLHFASFAEARALRISSSAVGSGPQAVSRNAVQTAAKQNILNDLIVGCLLFPDSF